MMDIIIIFYIVLEVCIKEAFIRAEAQELPLSTVYQWKQLQFDYETNVAREADIASGAYKPRAPVVIDVDVYYENQNSSAKVFITSPRFFNGIPASLGVVSEKTYNGEHLIEPYPSWSWHRNPKACNKDRLVSVYRVKIDECGRLWVLDSGLIGSFGQTCPPQVLAFDLKTNKLISRFEIPQNLYEARSVLLTIIPDVRDPLTCQDTFIYIADARTYSIIVYDVKNNQAWKATDNTFYPHPSNGYYTIQGQHFYLMDGILGMDLSPFDRNNPSKDRILFYHALSSVTENWVYTSYLRNQSRFENNPLSSPEVFHTYMNTRPSQSAALAIDKNGIEYFGLATQTSINCWNTYSYYEERNIGTVYYNPETMQFASGVKVITNSQGNQELWVVTMRFQKLATSTYNANETNFRISSGKISTLQKNPKCMPGSYRTHNGKY